MAAGHQCHPLQPVSARFCLGGDFHPLGQHTMWDCLPTQAVWATHLPEPQCMPQFGRVSVIGGPLLKCLCPIQAAVSLHALGTPVQSQLVPRMLILCFLPFSLPCLCHLLLCGSNRKHQT